MGVERALGHLLALKPSLPLHPSMPPKTAMSATRATEIVDTVADQAWYATPSVPEIMAKDIAHRNMRRLAQNDPDAVMAVLLRDPDTLVIEAQAILHHEWVVAKTTPSTISPFTGQPRRLEPELVLDGPAKAPPAKAAKAPQPSQSAEVQRARRAAKAKASGRTLRQWVRHAVANDGDQTREQLGNFTAHYNLTSARRHEELLGAIAKPPPAKKAKASTPAAPRPKLTVEQKATAKMERCQAKEAKAKANSKYWAEKAASYASEY